jgi:hypothetical protein
MNFLLIKPDKLDFAMLLFQFFHLQKVSSASAHVPQRQDHLPWSLL